MYVESEQAWFPVPISFAWKCSWSEAIEDGFGRLALEAIYNVVVKNTMLEWTGRLWELKLYFWFLYTTTIGVYPNRCIPDL